MSGRKIPSPHDPPGEGKLSNLAPIQWDNGKHIQPLVWVTVTLISCQTLVALFPHSEGDSSLGPVVSQSTGSLLLPVNYSSHLVLFHPTAGGLSRSGHSTPEVRVLASLHGDTVSFIQLCVSVLDSVQPQQKDNGVNLGL